MIIHGDARHIPLADESVDSIVTDPPYELGFMGKKWDSSGVAYSVDVWEEALRVLKPGGHLLAFGGSRTYHRMACAIEDAGFEIRDQIMWIYGSGFPKSKNIGNGWGTALKPAHEPIVVARKPIIGTVAANVLKHGTGAINVDGCRVGTDISPTYPKRRNAKIFNTGSGGQDVATPLVARWPANVIHDGISDDWSRFFYCAKASKEDRDWALDTPEKLCGTMEDDNYLIKTGSGNIRETKRRNHHPTVKPLDLMRYLCRLVTPPGGIVLDPFSGSGSTLRGAFLEGFKPIGIELSDEYCRIARGRMNLLTPAMAGLMG